MAPTSIVIPFAGMGCADAIRERNDLDLLRTRPTLGLVGSAEDFGATTTMTLAHVPSNGSARVGYVLKKFPRLSETFILNELLGLERLGFPVSVFSLNPADDEPRHAALAELHAPVVDVSADAARGVADHMDRLRAMGGRAAARKAAVLADRLPDGRERRVLAKGLSIAEAVQQEGLTHLHAHFMTVAAHTAYVAHLATGIPFTVTAHAKDIYRHGVDRWLFSEIGAAAEAVVTVCEANRDHIRSALVDNRTRLEVVYNGLPLDDLPSSDSDRDDRMILGVGRLVEKKGFDVLIDACRLLRDEGHDFRCTIIGDGDQRERLTKQIVDHDLGNRVVLAGPAPREDVLAAMCRARILAAPCVTGEDGNRDALPTVIIEAMAMGLPIVATPVGGIPEMIDQGTQGLIIPERDVRALADALLVAFRDDGAWRNWSGSAVRRVRSHFDREVTIRQLAATMMAATTQTNNHPEHSPEGRST